MWIFFDILPRWEEDEELFILSYCNKRCYHLHCDLHASFLLLGDLGGEGEKERSFAVGDCMGSF
jgi:hypothetical protein